MPLNRSTLIILSGFKKPLRSSKKAPCGKSSALDHLVRTVSGSASERDARVLRAVRQVKSQVHMASALVITTIPVRHSAKVALRTPTVVTGKEVRGMLEAATEAAERERTEKPRNSMEHSPTQEPTHTLTEMPTPFPTLGAAKKHEYELIGVPSAEPPSRPAPTHPSPAPRKCAHGGGHPTTLSEVPVVRAHALPHGRAVPDASPPHLRARPRRTPDAVPDAAPLGRTEPHQRGATSSNADGVQQHCQIAPAYNATQTMI